MNFLELEDLEELKENFLIDFISKSYIEEEQLWIYRVIYKNGLEENFISEF